MQFGRTGPHRLVGLARKRCGLHLRNAQDIQTAIDDVGTFHAREPFDDTDRELREDRINGMDMSDTEKITYSVLNKELKAIVWLGALLGGIIGLANIIIL